MGSLRAVYKYKWATEFAADHQISPDNHKGRTISLNQQLNTDSSRHIIQTPKYP